MNPVTRHRLSSEAFATLARGGGSAAITHDFWVTEESRRLLLVCSLLTEIAERPTVLGPLPPVGGVLDILATAQQVAPAAQHDLLMDPGVGSGCAYALRRLRGGAPGGAPLFVDLGIVHALALAAAARAGLTWSTRLPLRDGNVMLHTFGMAHFPGAEAGATVQASVEAGRIRLHDGRRGLVVPDERTGDAEWWALRRIETGGSLRLSVWLDDLDPLRDLGDPVPPARLDPAAFARWTRLVQDAWDLLCRDHPADAEAMAGGITAIVPLEPLPGWDTRSASNGEAFGGVMVSEPPDPAIMAVSLVHEYQHIKLGALLHLIRLTEPDDGSLHYAPWRDDPRPLAGLVQGIYAFFGITRFWRSRVQKTYGDERETAAYEYAYSLQQTAESLLIGLGASGLTPAGREVLEALQAEVEEWLAKPPEAVEARIDRLAHLTATSHRIGWLLRHFRPRDAEIVACAALLERHEPAVPGQVAPAVLSPHPDLRWRQQIPAVARRQAVSAGTSPVTSRDPISEGESALLAPDARAASEVFTGELSRLGQDERIPVSDDEARAWVGLAMSLAAEGDQPAAEVLSRRPDLVRAVYAQPAARLSHTPVEVARWLAAALDTAT